MHGPTFAPTLAPPVELARPPAAPRPRPARPAAKPEPAAGGGANLVLTYLRLHWMMILFAGSFAGAGLAYLAFSLVPNKYESTASLRVASAPVSFTGGGADPNKGQTAFAIYIKTLRTILKSDAVLGEALTSEKYRLDRLATIKAQSDPVKFLDEKLVVDSPEGQELINIRLEAENPDDVQKIVNAVQEVFFDQVIQRAKMNRQAARVELEKTANRFLADFKTRLGAIERSSTSAFAGAGPVAPAPGVVQAGGVPGPIAADPAAAAGPAVNPVKQDPAVIKASGVAVTVPGSAVMAFTDTVEYKRREGEMLQTRIVEADKALAAYPERIRQAKENQADAERKLREVGPRPARSAYAMAQAANLPDVVEKRRTALFAAEAAKRYGAAQDQTAPAVVAAKAHAAQTKAAADSAQCEEADKLEAPGYDQKLELARQNAKRAADVVRFYENAQAQAEKEVTQSKQKLGAITLDIKKADEAKAAIDLAKTEFMPRDKLIQDMIGQSIQFEAEALAPDRVQVQQRASAPRLKDGKKQVMAAAVAALAGFALVGFGAVGYEFRARKVSSLAELRAGGPTVVGVVPFLPDAAAADPLKRADVSEAIDKLRATVAQEWLGRGTATLLVTSPLADEGKALTAYRLATSLALAGARTLLVDFDLRSPTLHQFAGVENTHGVADILRGEADPRSGQILLPGGLAFLPAGEWRAPTTDDPAGLPPTLGAALDPLLHELRSDVDCLILHGHSILTAADTVELARRADAVLLCALYRETRMPLVKRAADRVLGMAGPAAGVVYIGATRHEALC